MKTLETLILTFNLDRVKQGLHSLGLNEMTLAQAPTVRRSDAVGREVSAADFVPRIQVRVVVPDHIADRVEEILHDAA